MKQTLKIGIPNGSMIDPKRGGLKEILDKARIYTKNIGTNSPPEITNIPWLEPVVTRPQELPLMALYKDIDVFFCGDDWAKETKLQYSGYNEKMLGLGIGKVDIVVAEKPDKEDNPLLVVASEYPYIAQNYLQRKSGEWVQINSLANKIVTVKGIYVLDSRGATEAKSYYGYADMIIEATQSGETLQNYGLTITDTVMSSECSFYCNTEKIDKDPWKREKTERVRMMLEGAVNSRGKDLVTFNVTNDSVDMMLSYIRSRNLFGDEETVVCGKNYSQFTLELPTDDKENPLIDIMGELRQRGARSIEGIPVSYSIR